MINDDLPTNQDYLDESFGTAAGLRELRDDDLDEFDVRETDASYLTRYGSHTHIVSKIGGETIKIFQTEGITVVEEYFDTLPPDKSSGSQKCGIHSSCHNTLAYVESLGTLVVPPYTYKCLTPT